MAEKENMEVTAPNPGVGPKEIFIFNGGKGGEQINVKFAYDPGKEIVHEKTVELTKAEQNIEPMKTYIENHLNKRYDQPRLEKVKNPSSEQEVKKPNSDKVESFNKLLETDPTKDQLNDWAARELPTLDISSKDKRDEIITKIKAAMP